MAERRMFSRGLLLSNHFLHLSRPAVVLYMYICLEADDDGLCGNTQGICRMCGIGKKYLQELIDTGWLLEFGGDVMVVAHWHLHNQIRKDRYKPSIHQEVAQQLLKCSDGRYVVATDGCQSGNQLTTQYR